MRLERGAIVLLDLDPAVGHEQPGVRPCVVVSDPDVNAEQRFPLIGVVPITGTPGQGALYPALLPGPSGLRRTSYALIDQIRSVDKPRVRRLFGRVAQSELDAIDEGLSLFLGLPPKSWPSRTATSARHWWSAAAFSRSRGRTFCVDSFPLLRDHSRIERVLTLESMLT